MEKSSKFSEFFNILLPLTTFDGASTRQGLSRLMLLRAIVVALAVPGLIVVQAVTELYLSASLQA